MTRRAYGSFVMVGILALVRMAPAQTPTPTPTPNYVRLYGSNSLAESTPAIQAWWTCRNGSWAPSCADPPGSTYGAPQYRMAVWDRSESGSIEEFTVYKDVNPQIEAAQLVLISQRVEPQTLASGNVTVMFPAYENVTTANCHMVIHGWVMKDDGTVRCLIVDRLTAATEYMVESWACSGQVEIAIAPCAMQLGDRLVFEIGTLFDAAGRPRQCTLRWGGDATDSPECTTLGAAPTGQEAGYVQIPQRITWAPTPSFTPTPYGLPSRTPTPSKTATASCVPTGSPQATFTPAPPTATPTRAGVVLGYAPQRRTATPCAVRCLAADFNGDCCVDLLDYTLFVGGFEACSTPTSACPLDRCRPTDLNDDCCTDLLDYTVFVREFEQCATPTPS